MKTGRVLLLYAVAALVACSGDSGAPPQAKSVPHFKIPSAPKKGPSAAELTAGMVEAATQGNSQLSVGLKFDLPRPPKVGQPMTVNLALMPQVDGSPADIAVSGGDGLTVAADSEQIELPNVAAGEVYREAVTVTPTVDGVLLLTLNISLKHDDATDSRTFSIPLIVER